MHIQIDIFFFFNDTATTEIYTLSLHDALPISAAMCTLYSRTPVEVLTRLFRATVIGALAPEVKEAPNRKSFQMLVNWKITDRKSTRLNSSHANISYAVFCLKKKKNKRNLVHGL